MDQDLEKWLKRYYRIFLYSISTQFKHNVNIIYQKILFKIQHCKEINQETNV